MTSNFYVLWKCMKRCPLEALTTSVLLPLIPVGFALHLTHQNPVLVFFVNLAAILPSGSIIKHSLVEVELSVGDVIGTLLSVTFR